MDVSSKTGTPANQGTTYYSFPVIATLPNGAPRAAFASLATNLVTGDTNLKDDFFVRTSSSTSN